MPPAVEAWCAVAVSAALHLPWFWLRVDPPVHAAPLPPVEVSLVAPAPRAPEPPAPPAVEPPEAPAAPAPRPAPRAASPRAPAPTPARPAAPEAAQAGRSLVAEGNDGPVDFSMVQGDGAAYAGGTTSSLGRSTSAVRGPVEGGAPQPPAPAPPPPPPPAEDRSRPAAPTAGSFACSHLFPPGPDVPDEATVRLSVRVRPDGSPEAVTVLRDPGSGFGDAARRCALAQRYQPALDARGEPTAGATRPFVVRFRR